MNNTAGDNKDQLNDLNEVETAQTAVAEKDTGATERYGKFKDVKSLLSAYNSLQSEFTRRCQRVKELERENGVLQAEKAKNASVVNPFGEVGSGKNSVAEEEPKITSADYIGKSKQRTGEFDRDGDNRNGSCLNNYRNDDELLKAVQGNDAIKSKIIREYLDGVKNSTPDVALMSGNGNAIVVPPFKPKNIVEAGELARHILSKGNVL